MGFTTSTTIKIHIYIKVNLFGLKLIFEVRWKTTIRKKHLADDGSAMDSTSVDGSSTIDGSASNNGSISYIITGLEEDSIYTITVTTISAVDSAVSVPVTGRTMEAGEIILSNRIIRNAIIFCLFYSSICTSP